MIFVYLFMNAHKINDISVIKKNARNTGIIVFLDTTKLSTPSA